MLFGNRRLRVKFGLVLSQNLNKFTIFTCKMVDPLQKLSLFFLVDFLHDDYLFLPLFNEQFQLPDLLQGGITLLDTLLGGHLAVYPAEPFSFHKFSVLRSTHVRLRPLFQVMDA